MMTVIQEEVFHLPVRYRLIVNMMAIIGWFFGRDERLTAIITLLRAELNEAAEDDESYDAFVDTIGDALRMRGRHA
ncbi:hypothetical protein QIH85_23885 [Bradyrhizobium japonicum]|uniref:hypothetical protein n=1 Tax=Bradyrhizobium japonicum TaxID=375 RepID=UPI0027155E97|nr:hypothetical protein [Bradyrhizobium japonicum]WLB24924.1 hypothetical protein QIH85_23885 [Bradyrhizobium japonicum]